jgi:hypothetical protein
MLNGIQIMTDALLVGFYWYVVASIGHQRKNHLNSVKEASSITSM